MQLNQCGYVWPGDRAVIVESLRCQRDPGHAGAHVAEVDDEGELCRYWWVPWTGERGVNRYPQPTSLRS